MLSGIISKYTNFYLMSLVDFRGFFLMTGAMLVGFAP